jgi:hypothetical protein
MTLDAGRPAGRHQVHRLPVGLLPGRPLRRHCGCLVRGKTKGTGCDERAVPQAAFYRNIVERGEIGAAYSVYHDRPTVVDLLAATAMARHRRRGSSSTTTGAWAPGRGQSLMNRATMQPASKSTVPITLLARRAHSALAGLTRDMPKSSPITVGEWGPSSKGGIRRELSTPSRRYIGELRADNDRQVQRQSLDANGRPCMGPALVTEDVQEQLREWIQNRGGLCVSSRGIHVPVHGQPCSDSAEAPELALHRGEHRESSCPPRSLRCLQ